MTDDEIPSGLLQEPIYVIENEDDPDDYEALQRSAEAGYTEDGGTVWGEEGIFSGALNGMPRIDMYRSWRYPEMYPDERQPVLSNWSPDDLEAYCGIYK
jgi:hypothetical protein